MYFAHLKIFILCARSCTTEFKHCMMCMWLYTSMNGSYQIYWMFIFDVWVYLIAVNFVYKSEVGYVSVL